MPSVRKAAVVATFPVLLGAISWLEPAAAFAASPAETFVQQNVDKGYAILNDAAVPEGKRDDNFRAFLLSVVDAKRIASFTLGVYARGASDADIQKFHGAFSDYVVKVVENDIAGNPGEKIEVTGSNERSPDDVVVTGKLIGSKRSNAPVNVAFRVRKNAAGAASVVDMAVEGVSLALEERDDFTAWLQQHHGDIGALAAELQRRSDMLRISE